MKIALAQINPTVGDLPENRKKIEQQIAQAKKKGAELILFPEMALIGYPPEDLLLLPSFIDAIEKEFERLAPATEGIIAIVGGVRRNVSGEEKGLFNTAAIFENGKQVGFQDKRLLPDYDVFSERRYFEPGKENGVWELGGKKVAITICEDLWHHGGGVEEAHYTNDPVLELQKQGPDIVLNLSASPYFLKRHQTRLAVLKKCAQTLGVPLFMTNQVGGNDSLIFDGYSSVVNEKGELVAHAKGFEEDLLFFDLDALPSPISLETDPIHGLRKALVLGVRDYFHKLGFEKGCLGLSGGIDSAVVACLAVEALGKENVLALGLPSRFSSEGSVPDSRALCLSLGIEFKEVSIEKPFESFLETLAPHFEGKKPDVTEENLQARIRAVILMAFSNKLGHLLLGTGNKSEMAMGYSTLYGDMCGGLSVLSDVTKAQVYALAKEYPAIPERIVQKIPSAELRPNQKDSDSLPEYPIVDAVLQGYVEEHLSPTQIAEREGIELGLVRELVERIHRNEYKRQQSAPGLRVTRKAFTKGRRFPIVQGWCE